MAKTFINQYQFNPEITPDSFELRTMSKSDDETFTEYAQRWREATIQVHLPLTETGTYYHFRQYVKGHLF